MRIYALFILIACSAYTYAAPTRVGQSGDASQSSTLSDLRTHVDTIKHQVNNQEAEIREFGEKLANLDSIIESVRDQLADSSKAQKEQLKGNAASIDSKIQSLETTSKSLVADLRQFQTHANESAAALAQYKQKIGELEKLVVQQNQDIEHLQSAVQALMELIQGKSTSATVAPKVKVIDGSSILYSIKQGDNLDKIARAHQTTIQAIKDLNGMTNDKIVVGKQLKIPSPGKP